MNTREHRPRSGSHIALGSSRAMRKQADKEVTKESDSDTERREEVEGTHSEVIRVVVLLTLREIS